MKWHKCGLVYAPAGNRWWARSYATIPTADVINDRVIRVYFAALDENRYGRIGYVDVDANDPQRILYETQEPVLDIGELGTFDDSGVNPSCVINFAGKKHLYYIGWQRAERAPYMLFSGLAISEDGGQSFRRYSRVPVLDRTDAEPYSRSAPFVMFDQGCFRAWYWSCLNWSRDGDWVHYNNVIQCTESVDGLHWIDRSQACIVPDGVADYSAGRPWVVKDGSLYKMWYSIRSKAQPYRLGYAESNDGLTWQRKDHEVGIARSDIGWDSEMICYPCVVDVNGQRYMFYNGNRHGSTGFGCAILES
jgi:predicted GH43/DUF377 family glycosyl hydrolase